MDLKGYVVLITGSSSGMGFEMAKELSAHGATVILSGKDRTKLDHAYGELSKGKRNVYKLRMDVRDEHSVSGAAEWFERHFDHLDMLVNNAGIGDNAPGLEELAPDHPFYDIPLSAFRAIVETNFIGYFLVTSKFVPFMIKRRQGSIVYVSTSTETMTRKGQLPYGPSKAAGEVMSAILVKELQDKGITVNVICPGGFTDTPMAGTGVKEFFQKNNLPILPADVLNKVLLFLASSRAKGITGEKIVGKDFGKWMKDKNIIWEEIS